MMVGEFIEIKACVENFNNSIQLGTPADLSLAHLFSKEKDRSCTGTVSLDAKIPQEQKQQTHLQDAVPCLIVSESSTIDAAHCDTIWNKCTPSDLSQNLSKVARSTQTVPNDESQGTSSDVKSLIPSGVIDQDITYWMKTWWFHEFRKACIELELDQLHVYNTRQDFAVCKKTD